MDEIRNDLQICFINQSVLRSVYEPETVSLFHRLQGTIDEDIRLLGYLEVTQVALSDMQGRNAQFASQGEDALRLTDALLLSLFHHLAKCGEWECVRCLGSHQTLAGLEGIGSIAILRHKICLVALQGCDGIAVSEANRYVATDDVLRDEWTNGIVDKDYGIWLFDCFRQMLYAIASRSIATLASRNDAAKLVYATLLRFVPDE